MQVVSRLYEESKPINLIIEEFQAGIECEENFGRVYQQYYPRVFGFFNKRHLAAEECEDLTQDTFVRVYQSLNRFRRGSRFETWLFVIAANIHRDRLRSHSAQKRTGEDIALESIIDSTMDRPRTVFFQADPLQKVLTQEQSRLMREVLEELPKRIRKCAILYFYEELRCREIADVLGISIGTVKAHLFQGKQKLRLILRFPANASSFPSYIH